MARKHKHEEHVNAEAWAVPYGDLVTLLLAFFVVMYSISSVNEGKFRTVSASMSAAFRGIPRTASPVAIGDHVALKSTDEISLSDGANPGSGPLSQEGFAGASLDEEQQEEEEVGGPSDAEAGDDGGDGNGAQEQLQQLESAVRDALEVLIEQEVVVVRNNPTWLEIEIQTDILFTSGVADPSTSAVTILKRVAGALRGFDNAVRVEGHTDNVPISNQFYASNWELSAGRAAAVVRLLADEGVAPSRMAVIGLGENFPAEDNATPEGRNANRRVTLVIPASKTSRRELWERRPVSRINTVPEAAELTGASDV